MPDDSFRTRRRRAASDGIAPLAGLVPHRAARRASESDLPAVLSRSQSVPQLVGLNRHKTSKAGYLGSVEYHGKCLYVVPWIRQVVCSRRASVAARLAETMLLPSSGSVLPIKIFLIFRPCCSWRSFTPR